MKNSYYLILFLAMIFVSCLNEQESAELILRKYIANKEKQFQNQEKKESLLFWQASLSGSKKDYSKLADLAIDFKQEDESDALSFQVDKFKKLDQKIISEKKELDFLKKMMGSGLISDSLLKRQLDIIYIKILGGGFNHDKYRKLIDLQMDIYHHVQNVCLEIDGVTYPENKIDSVRKESSDANFYNKIFDARRELASGVYEKRLELIRLRNEFARDCGYANYYKFMLASHELDQTQVDEIILGLDTITSESYLSAKKVIDKFLRERFNIDKNEIMPWYYVDERHVFFPINFSRRLDQLFNEREVVDISANFYEHVELNIQDVLDVSLINSPEIKSQMSYFINVDYNKDLRIMANVKNNLQGLRVIMSLCSHAAFFKNISEDIPYSLMYPNPIILEGLAVFFSNNTVYYDWLNEFVGIEPKDTSMIKVISRHAYQIEKLFKSRTMMAMTVFEKELYEDPEQNLGELWWDINEEYLDFNKPDEIFEYDWAINNYFFLMAGTSQSKLLAEMFASQLENTIYKTFEEVGLDSAQLSKNIFIGDFLKKNIFHYGNVLPWNTLIEKATGEKLKATYYYESIVNIY